MRILHGRLRTVVRQCTENQAFMSMVRYKAGPSIIRFSTWSLCLQTSLRCRAFVSTSFHMDEITISQLADLSRRHVNAYRRASDACETLRGRFRYNRSCQQPSLRLHISFQLASLSILCPKASCLLGPVVKLIPLRRHYYPM